MKVAVFDPFSGIAGDMTVGALLHAGADETRLREGLDSLGVPGYEVRVVRDRERGFACTRFLVDIDPDLDRPHRGLSDVLAVLDGGDLPERALSRAHRIVEALARGEAAAHGSTPDRIHFHEVGAIDSIVDVAATCLCLEDLGIEDVFTRPIRLGGGTVVAAHGAMPVPAPGAAALLDGLPVLFGGPDVELATPTGVAILSALASRESIPAEIRPSAVGYGAGTRPSESLPNLLRVFIADCEPTDPERVWQIEVNLDDVSPEILGAACERVREAGALDAYLTPVQMKKNRPGVLLTVLVPAASLAAVEDRIFAETTTFGLRRFPVERSILERTHVPVDTPWGRVRIKEGRRGGEIVTAAPEYDDCLRVARQAEVALRRVYEAARRAYRD
jgi:pyridinium-3,5-bisthiocarboxylic acid mononucleotide nickel chelatase